MAGPGGGRFRSQNGSKDELPKVKISGKTLRRFFRLFGYMTGHRWKFALGMLFLALTSSVALIFPRLTGNLVQASTISIEAINRNGYYLLLLFICQAFFSFMRVMLFTNVTEHMLANLRKTIYSHLVRMPMAFFSQKRVGELVSRTTGDIAQIGDTFTFVLAEFLRQFIIIIGGTISLIVISPKLAMWMVGTLALIAVVAVFFGRQVRKFSRRAQDQVAVSTTILDETMMAIASVKSYVNEFYEIARYGKSTEAIRDINIRAGIFRAGFISFIIFCIFGSIVFLVWKALQFQHAGEITPGQLTTILIFAVFIGASIGGIAEQYSQVQKAVGATERVLDIVEEEPEKINQRTGQAKRLDGKVEFNSVRFSYPSRKDVEVLQKISFEAKPGQTIAIVGPSGSGKSTIAQLLLRFYDPENGIISFDGKDARDFDLAELRENMAIVPQDVLLFGGSIRENIAYGKPNASQSEIEEAARKANALEFIDGFPEKFGTVVGDRGIQLSGGQRQRIAIARAVLKDPSILILDEATSSLDSESERVVQEALDKLMVGRTSFVIAHRLSTIRNADKIIVIEKGRVVEAGTHDELMQIENGLYRSLSRLQFASVK
ncbi:MAG: ATP-binding cassette domain-containing protein [Bacteroidetes bacterium]|nr:ATP-binding cassette domain-containing protein [Bacteroidota bacterium]